MNRTRAPCPWCQERYSSPWGLRDPAATLAPTPKLAVWVSAEWIDTITGEISRARVAPADRAGVRKFLAGFRGEGLEVALEATTGWRFLVEELERIGAEVHLAEVVQTAGLKGRGKRPQDRLG